MESPEPNAGELLRLACRELALKTRDKRRADGYKIPSCVYETLEDIGRIDGAIAALGAVWHKENEDYRKAMMHLTHLRWDLRKKLQEYL